MKIMEWIFEGIGTAIISLILGIVIGGVGGYNIGVKRSTKMKQKACDNATQTQIEQINIIENESTKCRD